MSKIKQDILGIAGGILLILFSFLDKEWSLFWLIAGIIILLWTLGSFFTSLFGDCESGESD
jgi:hypothetical protein